MHKIHTFAGGVTTKSLHEIISDTINFLNVNNVCFLHISCLIGNDAPVHVLTNKKINPKNEAFTDL